MKKFTSTFFFTLIAAFLFAGSLQYSYYFTSPSVKEVNAFQAVTFENTFLTGKSGEPALPYQAVKLLLPPGEEAISVNFTFEEENTLEGFFTIYPQQPSKPLSVESDNIFHQNKDLYASSMDYPVRAWGQYSTHFLNGHSFLLAAFTPLKYVPAEGSVSWFGKVTITVETRSTERAALAFENLNSSPKTAKIVSSFAQNPSMAAAYPAKSTGTENTRSLSLHRRFSRSASSSFLTFISSGA
jgi:hypothetical protein